MEGSDFTRMLMTLRRSSTLVTHLLMCNKLYNLIFLGDKRMICNRIYMCIDVHSHIYINTYLYRKVIKELSKIYFPSLCFGYIFEKRNVLPRSPGPLSQATLVATPPTTCSNWSHLIFVIFGAPPHFLGLYKGHLKVRKFVTK